MISVYSERKFVSACILSATSTRFRTCIYHISVSKKSRNVHSCGVKFVASLAPTCTTETAVMNNEQSCWKSVVGLEIHAQIQSASKLFSGAGIQFGAPVNTNVSLFDAAIPGTLPVLNRRCVEAGVLTALALSCILNPVSLFERKHYFYSDLPAGYQITQHRVPLAQGGVLEYPVLIPGERRKTYFKKSFIKQLQLEQDSGKSLHDQETCSETMDKMQLKCHNSNPKDRCLVHNETMEALLNRSLVDLSRAGVPLMELVFEPDIESGEEAAALVKELMLILQRLDTCSCKMEEGALRVDANVSVHREGEPLGVRSEVKNIGSVRAVAHAVEYEIDRQVKILEAGGAIANETRAWDADSRQTVAMRDKEEKQDYRYMPEPNLPPLRVLFHDHHGVPDTCSHSVNVNYLKRTLPELPRETREKLTNQYGILPESAIILVNENALLKHFRCIMEEKQSRDPKLSANILIMELLTILNKNKLQLESSAIPSKSLGEVVDLLQSKKLNLVTARKLLQEIVSGNPESPTKVMEKHGWIQITDENEIERLCTAVIEQNPNLVAQFYAGKTKVFNALVGKVAKITENRANMAAVVQVLRDKLSKLQNAKPQ